MQRKIWQKLCEHVCQNVVCLLLNDLVISITVWKTFKANVGPDDIHLLLQQLHLLVQVACTVYCFAPFFLCMLYCSLHLQQNQPYCTIYIVYYANMAATSKQKIKQKHTSRPKKLHNIQD